MAITTITTRRRPLARSRSSARLAALVAVGALALGSCAGADGGSGDATVGTNEASPALQDAGGGTAADLQEEVGTADQASGDDAVRAGGVDLVAVTDGRRIISRAEVDLTADDAAAVAREIADLAADAGGFVSGEETSRVGGTRTTIVLRVPPEHFDAILGDLAELAELTGQRIETDEVTEQVVDLESRISTAEASVVRLRALLERTGSVADIAQVESELLDRETTLETLRGQLRTIERQVDLATITVTVGSEDPAPVVEDDEGLPSFLGGLSAGWDALVLTLAAAAAALGVVLPWLLLVLLVGGPVWRVVRSRRRPSAPAANAA